MPLTEQQEKDLLKSHEELQTQIKSLLPLAEQIKPLTEKVSTLEKENVELKKGMTISSQEQAVLALKTKYPDVPESVIRNTPEANRDAVCKEVQDKFSIVKPKGKTDPIELWADAGGIGPTDEAEKAAMEAERLKSRKEAAGRGDVAGMLQSRTGEVLNFLRQSFVRK